MTETLNESRNRFNEELDRIEKATGLSFCDMLRDRGQPFVLVGFIDECVTFAVERSEDEVILAPRIKYEIEEWIKKLMADSRTIGKYIGERDNDGTNTESDPRNKA